jgi:hypothetical protein
VIVGFFVRFLDISQLKQIHIYMVIDATINISLILLRALMTLASKCMRWSKKLLHVCHAEVESGPPEEMEGKIKRRSKFCFRA